MKNEKVWKIAMTGVFAALSYVVFTFLQFKIWLPGGDATSIHFGNAVCVLGALILGGVYGGIGGAIGMTIGDLLDPVYVVYAPKTFILKFCIGLIAGLIAHKIGKINEQTDQKQIFKWALLAAIGGLLFNVIFDPLIGYFYKLVLLGKPAAEVTLSWNVAATSINAVLSTIASVVIYMALRPALQIIKCTPGITCVSGAMLLITKQPEYGENGVLVVGDVAVTPVPDAQQLAQIAVCTAQTAKSVAGFADPRVAMLSFSTKGSASHEVVDKVVDATKLAKELDPALKIDGELQADAALVPSVGERKAPGSEIAGKANVLVFPCLEVGNISYKLVQRLGDAVALGPILQGIARPVNDLSRGCSVDDIYKMVAITACQAMDAKA